ncbi:MAG: class B sortase [Bacilli bacterium]|nr:class B sortase [Bacilli bacterium]
MIHMSSVDKKEIIIPILIIIFIIASLIYINTGKEEIYKIEDRTKNIQEEKKNDTKMYKTTGWLRVQGTNIDSQVIYYTDEYDGSFINKNYVWNLSDSKKLENRTVIIGHNLLNLSATPGVNKKMYTRFDDLMAYIYYDFVKENKYIQYTIDNKNYLYKIYAVTTNLDYQDKSETISSNLSQKERNEYIKKVKEESIYKLDVDVNGNDNLITLVTCTRMYGGSYHSSFVIEGRMLRNGEKVTDYTVVKTDNYKKIEKLMKGDEQNA